MFSHHHDEARKHVLNECQTTYATCMRTVYHCTSDLTIPADDALVMALMSAANACYDCRSFSDHDSHPLRDAMTNCAQRCANVATICSDSDDYFLQQAVEHCRHCDQQINEYLHSVESYHVAV